MLPLSQTTAMLNNNCLFWYSNRQTGPDTSFRKEKILKKVYSLLVFHATHTFSIQNGFQNTERHHGKILVIVKLFVVYKKAPSYVQFKQMKMSLGSSIDILLL